MNGIMLGTKQAVYPVMLSNCSQFDKGYRICHLRERCTAHRTVLTTRSIGGTVLCACHRSLLYRRPHPCNHGFTDCDSDCLDGVL